MIGQSAGKVIMFNQTLFAMKKFDFIPVFWPESPYICFSTLNCQFLFFMKTNSDSQKIIWPKDLGIDIPFNP